MFSMIAIVTKENFEDQTAKVIELKPFLGYLF